MKNYKFNNRNASEWIIQNPKSYIYLVFFSMLYMSIMLCNAILTNRYIGSDTLFVLGGTLTSPFVFILNDIISEIYGYRIIKYVILYGFLSQTIFCIICIFAINLPYPHFFTQQKSYHYILGPSLLWIDLSGCIAFITASLVNSRIITKWKILLKGRKFWLRSLGSSTFAEALYSFIGILMMEILSISLHNIIKVIIISYLIKVLYCIIFAYPAQILVNYIKKSTKTDVYDFSENFTPFKYFNKNSK